MNRRTGASVAGLFAVVALLATGGRAGATPPVPMVRDVNMGNQATNDRELSIAVDPADSDHLAAGANMRGGPNGQRWYVSTDGGRNWTNGALPFGTIASGMNNGTNTLMSDPALDFGSSGDIYYGALAHGTGTTDPCDLFVSHSANDGGTWTDPASGLVADGGASICNDKEFILVDRAHGDNVYVAWTPFGGTNNNELVFSRDTGGNGDGLAFSAPLVLSTDTAQDGCQNHGAELTLQQDGDLYVTWTTFCSGLTDGANASVWIARSSDQGQNFGAPVRIADLDNVNPAPDPGFRSRSFPSLDAAVDVASGRLFVVWADYTDTDGGDADILISSSANDGANWTAPTEVDIESDTDTQVMPWVSVANGRVSVAFYSLDNNGTSPTNNWNTYLAYGAVGATPTFSQVQVSSVGTAVTTGFLGDYLAVVSSNDQKVHLAWGDGRPGVGGATDAFYGLVDFSPPQLVTAAASPPALPWGSPTTITATVTGLGGEAEEHIPVTFTVTSSGTPSATTGTGTTDAAGHATFSYSNGTAGTDTVTVWADLDENGIVDSGETTTVLVTWLAHPTTTTYTGPTSGEYHDTLTVSGTLFDSLTATPLAGQTLTIGFGTDSCTGVTDATGTAVCDITPQGVPGPSVATASFAGDGQYAASVSAPVPFTLNREESALLNLQPPFLGNGDNVTVSATLAEDGVTPIAGRAVTFTLGSGITAQTCTDPSTDATGRAECSILVNQPAGPSTLRADFAGDAYYLPSTATRDVVVFTWTAGGNFVIGDGNAITGGRATFWSSTWNRLNTVSGGMAPSAFKGFANDPAGRTTCGLPNWSTDPGNSPPPPQVVPSYTAMLVTSSVTKSGSIIAGTKPSIVIVHVDPGYAPNPGHPGTAVVLGVLCP